MTTNALPTDALSTDPTSDPLTIRELAPIISRMCGIDVDADALAANPAVTFNELGIDSLGVMSITSELGKRARFDDSNLDQQNTAGQLLELFNAALPGAPARTSNTIVVGAPLEVVWELTNDLTRWTQLFSEYAEVEVLEETADRFLFRLTMFPDEQGRVWSWVSERVLDPVNRMVRARRVETGPFEFMNIEWVYVDDGVGGTVMRWEQEFRMRPDAPLTTPQMAARINQNTLIQMALIKKRVEALVSAGVVQP